MKIVHLTSVHDPRDPRISKKMLPSIVEAGHEAVLVAVAEPTLNVQAPWHLEAVAPGTRRQQVQGVMNAATRLAPETDVFHLHDPELLLTARSLKKSGARVVYDMHEDYRSKGPVAGRMIRAVERCAFTWLDHVILAEESYTSIVRGGVPFTTVLNYHVQDIRSEPRQPPQVSDSVSIVYTGVISNARGLPAMLELARLAAERNSNWKFTFAGICHRPVERENAEAFIDKHKLESTVSLVGWDRFVDPDDIDAIRSDADVGLVLLEEHQNYTRSIPTKFYEYMADGLPFVCSDFPAWKRFVDEHGCSVSCDPADAESAFKAIDELIEDRDRYRVMSANGIGAAEQYHWNVMSERLLEVYQNLDRSD